MSDRQQTASGHDGGSPVGAAEEASSLSAVSLASASPAAVSLARLRWRCRRGMRELDVVFQRYLEERYPSAPPAEQRAFESLIELQDPQLLDYLVGREAPADPELVDVIARLVKAGT